MVNFTQYFVDESIGFFRSLREVFWGVAEQAERTRARLRVRREQSQLGTREATIYRRLGTMGLELLEEHVAVASTPEVKALLEEINLMVAERARMERVLEAEFAAGPTTDWRRLAQQLTDGECVLRWIPIASALPTQRVGIGTPPGICIAVHRGDQILQASKELALRHGDTILIVSPTVTIRQWHIWAGDTSTCLVD